MSVDAWHVLGIAKDRIVCGINEGYDAKTLDFAINILNDMQWEITNNKL